MSDQHTSLPIRTESDGTDERLHSKIVDFTSPGGSDNQLQVSEKLAHVRNFAVDPSGTKVQERLSEEGHTSINGLYDAVTNTDPSLIGMVAHARDAAPADSQLTERLTSIQDGGGTVRALDISLHDEAGESYTKSNPLPVSLEESEGDEVHDFDEGADVAADATSEHTYTVGAGKTLQLKKILASASGKMKVELQVALDGTTFATHAVWFNSTATPNVDMQLMDPIAVPAAGVVKLIRTNRDNQAQSLYSTISGVTYS